MPFLKSEDTGMEVFPMVNNFDGIDWVDVSAFLNNPDARARFRQQVAAFLATDRYHGLMIDFETLARKAQPGYLALLKELSDDLHAKGMKLYVSVQARNEEYDYAAVAAHVDGVVLMNYDEHYPRRALPGPVASQDWFTDNLKAAGQSDSARQADLGHRQLRLRLGAKAEARPAAAGRERHQRDRAGCLAGRARLGSGRGL